VDFPFSVERPELTTRLNNSHVLTILVVQGDGRDPPYGVRVLGHRIFAEHEAFKQGPRNAFYAPVAFLE
jgi:hypothetical protein